MSEEAYPESAATLASMAEANRILRKAGWTPVKVWKSRGVRIPNANGDFACQNLVGGITPDGLSCHMKDWTQVTPDDPEYDDNTPDQPHEAAAWLVARFKAPEPETNPLSLDGLRFGMPSYLSADHPMAGGVHEGDGEVGAVAGSDASPDLSARDDLEGRDAFASPAPIDADFAEVDFAALEAPEASGDLGAEILDMGQIEPLLIEQDVADFAPEESRPPDGPGAFIFGDNLEQKRTAAIGVVTRLALERLPAVDYAKLSELRNFAMGVTENRWPDDPAKRDELDAEEAQERRRRMVEAVRDEKVGFLVGATREQIEAFDPSEGWP